MDVDQPVSESMFNPSVDSSARSLNPVQELGTGTLDLIYDPDFLESVLKGLPGVDTENEEVRKAINALTKTPSKKESDDKRDEPNDDEGNSSHGGSKT